MRIERNIWDIPIFILRLLVSIMASVQEDFGDIPQKDELRSHRAAGFIRTISVFGRAIPAFRAAVLKVGVSGGGKPFLAIPTVEENLAFP